MTHIVNAILIVLALIGAFFIGLMVWAVSKLLNEIETYWKTKEFEDEHRNMDQE